MTEKLKSLLENTITDSRELKKKFKTGKVTQGENELEFVKGRFSKIEISQIDMALEQYLTERNLERDQLHSLIHSKKCKQKIKGFFKEILEKSQVNRSVDQLYFYLARKYSEITTKNIKWTKEEDQKLLNLVEFKGFKWKEISQELNRKDVKVRYEKITRKSHGYAAGKWSKEETDLFIQGKKMLEEKYNIKNPAEFTHWTELSLLVKTRSYMQCRNKYIHSTFKIVEDIKVNWTLEDDSVLLSRLKQFCLNAKDDTEIIWNNIAFKEWVPWNGACLQRRWTKLKERIPSHLSFNNFMDQLNYISENLRELSRTTYMNRDLFTCYSSKNTRIWNLEESRELLSHIIALFINAKDENDVDWDALAFSSWDGAFLRNKWLEIKAQIKPKDNLGFIEAVGYCQENLHQVSNDDDSLKWSSEDETGVQGNLQLEQELELSEEPSKRLEKRKIVPDTVPRKKKKLMKESQILDSPRLRESAKKHKKSKKKSQKFKSADVIEDSSSAGESAKKHKKSKKKSQKFKSADVIEDSSSAGESAKKHTKSKKKNKDQSAKVMNDSSHESNH